MWQCQRLEGEMSILRREAETKISNLENANHQYAEEIKGLQESNRTQMEDLQKENRKVHPLLS